MADDPLKDAWTDSNEGSSLLKYAAYTGGAYTAAPLLRRALQVTYPVQSVLSRFGEQASTMIEGYYAPGAKKSKLGLAHILGVEVIKMLILKLKI